MIVITALQRLSLIGFFTHVFLIFLATSCFAQQLDLKSFEAFQGMPIRHITIRVDDVFNEEDPAEDKWIFRKANALKVNTRESVIRSQLLFAENEVFDFQKVNESIRILQAQSYLISAEINVLNIDDSQVDIEVTVRDGWTLEPRISYGRDGGETKTGFGFGDSNVLGTGDSIMIAYASDEVQNTISYAYTKNNLFNKRVVLGLTQVDGDDGQTSIIRLEKPFYSLASKIGWGISSEKLSQIHSIKRMSEELNAYRGRTQRTSAHVGYALRASSKSTLRLYAGADHEFAEFDPTENTVNDVPSSYDRQYPWIRAEFIENKFGAYKNLYLINRRENINLGNNFSVRLGFGEDKRPDAEKLLRFVSHWASVFGFSNKHLATLNASIDVHYLPDVNRFDSSLFSTAAEYHHFINTRNRWYIQLKYDLGENSLPHELLSLGGSEDLRGYPLSFQSGEERFVFNIERRRYFEKEWFNLFYLGAVAFVDFGKISSYENLSNGNALADIGLGLRITPSKLGNPTVVHLDLARPMIDTGNAETSYFSMSVSTRF